MDIRDYYISYSGNQIREVVLYIEKTDGTPYTGLVYNTSGLSAATYDSLSIRAGISLGNWNAYPYVDYGFEEVSSAYMPGLYKLRIPSEAYQRASTKLAITLYGAANMRPTHILVNCLGLDIESDAPRVRILEDSNPTVGYVNDISNIAELVTQKVLQKSTQAALEQYFIQAMQLPPEEA